MLKLATLVLSLLMIYNCAAESKDDEAAETNNAADDGTDGNTDDVETDGEGEGDGGTDEGNPPPANAGTLALDTSNLGALINDVNAELVADGSELDVPAGVAGTLVLEGEGANLQEDTDGTQIPVSISFRFAKFELSTDGESWVTVNVGTDGHVFDLVGGDEGITSDVSAGEYKYAYVEIPDYSFQRKGCDRINVEEENVGVVLTTAEQARALGQRTDQVFAEYIGHTYWDLLQEALYYLGSRPSELRAGEVDFASLEGISDYYTDDPYEETEAVLAWAKAKSSKDEYSNPETVDNTRPQCRHDAPADTNCNDYLGTNTHVTTDGQKIDSYYWLLSQPIVITEGESTSLLVTLDPTGEILMPDDCDVGPRDPAFIIGTPAQVKDALREFGGKK